MKYTMINRIVSLKTTGQKCRILDSFISNGNTRYLVLVFATKNITTIYPFDFDDIVEFDNVPEERYSSILDEIIRNGL